jgi:hypothetical protein
MIWFSLAKRQLKASVRLFVQFRSISDPGLLPLLAAASPMDTRRRPLDIRQRTVQVQESQSASPPALPFASNWPAIAAPSLPRSCASYANSDRATIRTPPGTRSAECADSRPQRCRCHRCEEARLSARARSLRYAQRSGDSAAGLAVAGSIPGRKSFALKNAWGRPQSSSTSSILDHGDARAILALGATALPFGTKSRFGRVCCEARATNDAVGGLVAAR